MLVIGLTGGIGSGKSTVAELFSKHGVPVIDADVIAREVTQLDQPAFTSIIRHFSGHIIQKADGSLDRQKLRHIIFNNPEQRRWLENLLHPIIRAEIERRVKTLSAPYCVAVVPLLLEVTPYPFIDRILVVDAPESLQIERVVSRDKMDKSQIEAILKTQISREKRMKQAHDIIVNDGVKDLKLQVDELHKKYLALSR